MALEPREASISDAIRHLLDDVRTLFREEVALARVEIRQELTDAGAAAAWMAARTRHLVDARRGNQRRSD